ncbi:tripartite tricarboxylate transporter substrate binding protein [Bradyrhizobium sp. KBS0727]|uniref:Bug family tripartite tricarboxylate transporter substrate binding protein n=1 Tax=unclassified Bradyrhizobium TaxID=2631580 RepID=UPI00110D6746|nr:MULTISPECIES: tripartite tricarboxylate transporter substrate binding protein [unclassified Bradyrhizobium]QDW40546.1 tripartite tricarboxylate transporter substrate binding protein [Bradyrhizobium sp. KBS0725]QDW47151.1 tripartite tricarboxylate transporter substrate binding protein [Bradyrhizobium sp. KBS0727]
MNTSLRTLFLVACATLSMFLGNAMGAEYPNSPIKVTVPYPAGGLVDIVMRVVCEAMSAELHQPFIIESRPGAGGTIATSSVARADADGYTLLAITDSHATNPLAFKNLPYDSLKDFAPIGLIGNAPVILSVHKSVPVKSVKEFVELARKEVEAPLTYGSVGYGSASHLAVELFKARVGGIDLLHVPYKGGAPAINDLVAGHIKSMFVSPIVSMQHIQSGTLVPLAIAAKTRFPLLPDVMTMEEAGFPMEAGYWTGLVAPAKTPAYIVGILAEALQRVLERDDIRKRLAEIGLVISYKKPAEFTHFIADQTEFWKSFAAQSNVKFN